MAEILQLNLVIIARLLADEGLLFFMQNSLLYDL
jgi:hypothetical protein